MFTVQLFQEYKKWKAVKFSWLENNYIRVHLKKILDPVLALQQVVTASFLLSGTLIFNLKMACL